MCSGRALFRRWGKERKVVLLILLTSPPPTRCTPFPCTRAQVKSCIHYSCFLCRKKIPLCLALIDHDDPIPSILHHIYLFIDIYSPTILCACVSRILSATSTLINRQHHFLYFTRDRDISFTQYHHSCHLMMGQEEPKKQETSRK